MPPASTASTSPATSTRKTSRASTRRASARKTRSKRTRPALRSRIPRKPEEVKEKKLPQGLHRDTLAVRTGLPASQWGENSEALYLTSGFVQPDSETMAHRFANPQEGYTYGRTSNPTVTSFELRLAAMEGTEA